MKRAPKDCENMAQLRAAIDELDRELMAMLRLRVDYIDRAAELKPAIDMPARVEERVEEVAMNARKNAQDQGLDPDMAEKLWREMIEWSIAREEKKMRHENDG